MVFRLSKAFMLWSTFLALIFSFCALLFLTVLYFKPLPLGVNFVRHFLPAEHATSFSFDKMTLAFKRNFVLEAENMSFQIGTEDLHVEEARIIVSLPYMLLGKLRPTHVYVNGMKTPDAVLTEDFLYFAGMKIPFAATGEKSDFVKTLNNFGEHYPVFSQIKLLRISRFESQLDDVVQGKNWLLKPIEINLKKTFLNGERISLETRLTDKEKSAHEIPFQLILTHNRQADYLDVVVRAKHLDIDMFKNYLPQSIPLSGTLETELSMRLNKGETLQTLSTKSTLENGEILVSMAYDNPFKFKKLSFEIDIEDKFKVFTLKDIHAVDTEGFAYNLKGVIDLSSLKEPYLDLHLEGLEDTTLNHLKTYLPNKRIQGVTNWIQNRVRASTVKNVRVSYTGNPLKIPHCPEGGCGFYGTFDLENAHMNFLDRLTDATDLKGQFKMEHGRIDIYAEEGRFNTQRILPEAHIEIYDFFDMDKPTTLNVTGKVSGELKALLETIEPLTRTSEPWPIADISGTHVSDLFLSVPLFTPDFENIRIETRSEVKNVASRRFTNGRLLQMHTGEVHLSKLPADGSFLLSGAGEGALEDLSLKTYWKENLNNPYQETLIDLHTTLPNSHITQALDGRGINVLGDVPLHLKLSHIHKMPIHAIADLDFEESTIKLPALKWSKHPHEKLHMVLNANFNGMDDFDVHTATLSGEDVSGKGTFSQKQKTTKLTLSDFKIGKSHVNAEIINENIKLSGKVLDLSFIDLAKLGGDENRFSKNTLEADMRQVLLPNGLLSDASLRMKTSEKGVENLSLTGFLPENKYANVQLEQLPEKDISLTVYAEDGGYALKAMRIFNQLDKGILRVNGVLNEKGYGKLNAHLKGGSLLEAPALFQLFSILALEDVITFNKGLYFDSIRLPLKITEKNFIFDPLTMKGPSVNLRAKGKLSKTGVLDAKGQLMPMSRLNKLITKIPVVGKAITGSQGGLLVADFTATGDIKKPDISSNPFSFVTPGVLKDLFGIIAGEGYDPTQENTEGKVK